jgi:hypothetical protein
MGVFASALTTLPETIAPSLLHAMPKRIAVAMGARTTKTELMVVLANAPTATRGRIAQFRRCACLMQIAVAMAQQQI